MMETSVLKAFAGDARRQLLSEVRARLDLVLAEGSTQRHEYAAVIAKLETAIGDAGGGEAGRVTVVDRVAYTWFNRIIALRFMDANAYTDLGVVSPSVDRPDGQPEVLVDAKRGEFDADVVASADAQRIMGLLNGSVTSSDPESEAFGLLLAAYCRFWNKSMPFMFEQDSDYTELLMPSDLLSDESVIARAVAVLTPDVCADVEVIGWLYQFYIAERKDEVFAGFKKGKKAGAAELPAATQLFTPDWIVRYLVENSLGRLWLLNRPDSTLAESMDYYIAPVDEESDFLEIEGPEDIKVMDPACGSGHMLTYAFDLLYSMYEEDGYSPADIPALILSRNLYGTEIDQRAGSLAGFALTMKARTRQRTFFAKGVTPNVCVLEPVAFTQEELDQLTSRDGDWEAEKSFLSTFADADTLGALVRPDEALMPRMASRFTELPADGSLFDQELVDRTRRVIEQARYLSSRYQIVVANPPYMGSKNMGEVLGRFARTSWQSGKTDLYALFMQRCSDLAVRGGGIGMITMQGWMFLNSFADFRRVLLSEFHIGCVAHLGTRAFDSIGGEVVSTTALVFWNSAGGGIAGSYIRLVDEGSSARKAQLLRDVSSETASADSFVYRRASADFGRIPGSPLAYWIADEFAELFEKFPPVGATADLRSGMATGNNDRFLRFWFEVSLGAIGFGHADAAAAEQSRSKWIPYNKGGTARRWFGNNEYVVLWENDGAAIKAAKEENLLSGKITANNSKCWNQDRYFQPCITWSSLSTGRVSIRYSATGFIFDTKGQCLFVDDPQLRSFYLGLLNSTPVATLLEALSPTMDFNSGSLAQIPDCSHEVDIQTVAGLADSLVTLGKTEWDADERSWGFPSHAWVLAREGGVEALSLVANEARAVARGALAHRHKLETELDELISSGYGLTDFERPRSGEGTQFRDGRADSAALVSYAVGCMVGRYSLDECGLILADQGDTLKEFVARVPEPSFMPDEDNVIPVLADDWFDDDIVERFRLFLRVAFGEEHFEENLRFVEESLGKDIRKYFLTDFYKDHVQRYKKRPIYWMFSSPKGTFNALIYMHRYNPSTVSTVLNEYLREFQAKLEAELNGQGRISADPSTPAREKARAEKESDKLRKMIAELKDYEHDVLYPLASQQISIDLDDGVKANYPKFGTALKKIPGLEAASD